MPSSDINPDRLVTVTLDDWEGVLSDALRIELSAGCTVLVGKNAVGKSLILESITYGAAASCRRSLISALGPHRMMFELELSGTLYAYSYQWKLDTDLEDTLDIEISSEPSILWSEVCKRVDTNSELWRVEEGRATYLAGEELRMPPQNGLLHLKPSPSMSLPEEVGRIGKLMRGVRLLTAGVPRGDGPRYQMQLYRFKPDTKKRRGWMTSDRRRVVRTMVNLLQWYETDPELLESVVSVARRLGAFQDLKIQINELETNPTQTDAPSHTAKISIDGYDFGFASDGTLRLLEIISNLIDPAAKILLLEEPETAIHPGLLRRLLAEIEAHAVDRQIVISTHSPIIVDWASPESLRLVTRHGNHIEAARLSEDQKSEINSYLDDDLSVSDAIYSGEWG